MRYALILAGGSGVRLWPMSRQATPKQLLPFIGGKSLLELTNTRLEGIVPDKRRYVCAGEQHRDAVLQAIPLSPNRFLGEPVGRDTLNAVGLSAAVIGAQDPDAVIGVFPADHLIEPVDLFQQIASIGYSLAEQFPEMLVTFGIEPSFASTGYGYLELGRDLEDGARQVQKFKEKPDAATAEAYYRAGPERYLWNSGMFVWRAATLLDCIRRFAPGNHRGLSRIAEHWSTPARDSVLAEAYPALPKISVDYAVMEPASQDQSMRVAAVPMPLRWLDVGSWLSFAKTCPADEQGNALAAERTLLAQTAGTLVVSSDPKHLIAVAGCKDLIVVHTPNATLVCRADQAEKIKELQQMVGERFGKEYL